MNQLKYSPLEERLNIISHASGLICSICALYLLVQRALTFGDTRYLVSFGLFGVSLIVLYTASTLYHKTQNPQTRARLRVFDHAAIYMLIAGSYTPFALVVLKGLTGWIILTVIWLSAICGIVLKLFFTGRFKLLSTLTYLLMGWMAIFVVQPLVRNLSEEGLFWLAGGGLAYTIGAVLYSIKKLPMNHAVFHFFVLIGSACHFIAIFFYI